MEKSRDKQLLDYFLKPFDKRVKIKYITEKEFLYYLLSPKRKDSPRYKIGEALDGKLILKEIPLRNVV